jgi:hypothetical protein
MCLFSVVACLKNPVVGGVEPPRPIPVPTAHQQAWRGKSQPPIPKPQ